MSNMEILRLLDTRSFITRFICNHPIGLYETERNRCSCLICGKVQKDIGDMSVINIEVVDRQTLSFIIGELRDLLPLIPELHMYEIASYIQDELSLGSNLNK